MRLSEHIYQSISSIKGPLIFVERVKSVRLGEIVRIVFPDGHSVEGEALRIDGDTALIQVFGSTQGLDIERTKVIFTDSIKQVPLSDNMIGRVFNGSCCPIDGLPMFVPEKYRPVVGLPINPVARARPEDFIETGLSCIDGLNTLVKGQKLPVFSMAGQPAKELIAWILRNSQVRTLQTDEESRFVIVFVALGLTFYDYSFYMDTLRGMKTDFVAFINMADDPVVERLIAPRLGLTVAEYLAFERNMDVLVIITDMTNYCDALREVSTAREELPGRRGYPGYMYSDLASIYERAERIKNLKGSITMIPVVTMPEDDITHPIPDLTGYITEGQIVLSRELHQKGIFPPVDVLQSLSRLMQRGIGEGKTRADHRKIANSLYRYYAKGRELRTLESIVGREGMTEEDKRMLDFTDAFEREFVNQSNIRRDIDETLNKGIEIIKRFSLMLDER